MDIEQIVRDVGPEVQERVRGMLAERVASSISYTLNERVKELAEKYFVEHVLPDVEAKLRGSHEQIVEAVCKSVQTACDGLADALTKQVTKTLGEAHQTKKIAEILFGRGY